MGVERKLRCISDLVMKPLVDALLNGLQSRFGEVKNSFEYRMASCLHPKFKLAFLPPDDRAHYKQLLMSYVQDVDREVQLVSSSTGSKRCQETSSSPLVSQDTDEDDLYSFLHKPDTSVDAAISDQVCIV